MTIINRSNKPNGSTNWVDGDEVDGAGLNADINTIYNEFNGGIDTTNLDAAAGIVDGQIAALTLTNASVATAANIETTKVEDASGNTTLQNFVSSAGDSDAATKAVTLREELRQLRNEVKRLSTGLVTKLVDGSTSGIASDGASTWFEGKPHGRTLIQNGAFMDAGANGSGTPPFGWTTEGAPSTLAPVVLDAAEGAGVGLHVVDGGAGTGGVSQVLALKPSTKYQIVTRVKPVTTRCQLVTTGANAATEYDDLALVSASGGSVWQTLSGLIKTDATPTDITVKVIAADASSEFHISTVDVYEVSDTLQTRKRDYCRRLTAASGAVWATAVSSTTHSVTITSADQYIRVLARATDGLSTFVFRLEEDVDGLGYAAVDTAPGAAASWYFSYCREAPAVGSTYSYRLGVVSGSPSGTSTVFFPFVEIQVVSR